jgi:ABC-type Fe3+-siderophore transport system permease subunit
MTRSKKILILRIAYWLGIVLDALAFVQMAFPAIGKKMLKVTMPLEPDYIFGVNLGAGLMLAWTLLLFWADRKPFERRMIIPLTMIVMVWNACTLVYGVRQNLLPVETLLPQMIALSIAFVWYAFSFIVTIGYKKEH